MPTISIAAAQLPVSGTALTLVERQVVPAAVLTLTLAGAGDLTGRTLTIAGLDADGNPQSEVLGSLAAGSVNTVNTYLLVNSITPAGGVFTGYTAAFSYQGTGPVSYNCACDDTPGYSTLATLRVRLLRRLGYSASAPNPPPGMSELLDDFLRSAQEFLYRRYNALRTERIFSWVMTPGVRFYDLPANIEVCAKRLDALKITWAGVEDLNGAWLPMQRGIPPEFYTSVSHRGIPSRYEIRQCIEVMLAPDAPYTLRIKGSFGLQAFTADSDQTSIDSELVFLWALANAKNHYGQPDAKDIASQAMTHLGQLVAGTHGTARYVPGAAPGAPLPAPVFLPLVGP